MQNRTTDCLALGECMIWTSQETAAWKYKFSNTQNGGLVAECSVCECVCVCVSVVQQKLQVWISLWLIVKQYYKYLQCFDAVGWAAGRSSDV